MKTSTNSVFNGMLRLMFGSIISSFTEVNMDFLNIPEIFKSKLMKIIEIIKKSGQKKKKFYKKSRLVDFIIKKYLEENDN